MISIKLATNAQLIAINAKIKMFAPNVLQVSININ